MDGAKESGTLSSSAAPRDDMSRGDGHLQGIVANRRAGLRRSPRRNLLRPMSEETYGEDRARHLEALLRALAGRIRELDLAGKLLADPGELLRLMGDIRSELFTYEVRATFDTPEVAEHRRIVAESQTTENTEWQRTEWTPDEDDPESR